MISRKDFFKRIVFNAAIWVVPSAMLASPVAEGYTRETCHPPECADSEIKETMDWLREIRSDARREIAGRT